MSFADAIRAAFKAGEEYSRWAYGYGPAEQPPDEDAYVEAASFPERVTFQLEPARAKRLIEVLRSAGAHPSGLGSYEAANDANALAEDIEGMVQR